MAGYLIAVLAVLLPLVLGAFRLGRPRVVVGVGGVFAFGWLIALAMEPPADQSPIPVWFLAGMVLLLYAIWCGGLWLGVRVRRARIRHRPPG
jgi:hypothetical protein